MLTAKKGARPPEVLARIRRSVPLSKLPAAPQFQALSLSRTTAGAHLTVVCVIGVVAVTLLESARPGLASLGSLLFIPVLASAWLVDRRDAVIVSALAVAARIAGYTIAGVDIGTAIAEVITLGSLAIVTSVAAQALADARERDARIARHRREVEILEERERIAMNLTDTAIRRLYALTLHLQAISSRLDQPDLRPAIGDAIGETDSLITDFRELIFKSDGKPTD